MTLSEKFALFKDQLRGAIRSKTIWVNAMFALVLANLPDVAAYAADQLPALQPYMGAASYASMMKVIITVNILLRFRTKVPLEAK